MRLHTNNLVMGVHSYNIIPNNVCNLLIELFENSSKKHERVDNKAKPNFTQLNLNQYCGNMVPELCKYFFAALTLYKKDVPAAKYLPEVKSLEEFRIKRYEVGGLDRFDEHVDVGSYASAKRGLAMLFYLNDVESGGRTLFPYQDETYIPIKGNVIVFPPTWEYPHTGEPPISNTKYIMSTYLHYH